MSSQNSSLLPGNRRRSEAGTMRRSQETKSTQGRRFKKLISTTGSESLLPRSSSSSIPRKKIIMANRIRALALCAFLLVFVATITTHRQRRGLSPIYNFTRFKSFDKLKSLNQDLFRDLKTSPSNSSQTEESYPVLERVGDSSDSESKIAVPLNDFASINNTTSRIDPGVVEDSIANKELKDESSSQNEVLAQLEYYTRSDLLDGTRSLCRISNACILGNGLISVPLWLSKEDRLMKRCGLNPPLYHDSNGPRQAHAIKNEDLDLIHHYRIQKLKEPSALMTEFFTETILHSAFVLETFSNSTFLPRKESQSHCILSENTSSCDQNLGGQSPMTIKPAIVVPEKVLSQEGTWEKGSLSLIDNIYGHNQLKTLNLFDVVDDEDKSKTSNMSATCYRSIFTTEAKFKDLPSKSFATPKLKLFAGNQISKSSERELSHEMNGSCEISIALLKRGGSRTLQSVDILKEKLETISTAALPKANFKIEVYEISKDIPFKEQIEKFRSVDILVGGTSHALNHIAFLPIGASVFEIFPFAWQPNTFEDLSRVSGITHRSILALPQTTEFKTCIEHELFQLRKQDRLQGDENPAWVKEMDTKWDEAVAEFALSGRSTLYLNSDTSGISNFHTRACARRQTVDINVEELSKAVLLDARDMCKKQMSAVL